MKNHASAIVLMASLSVLAGCAFSDRPIPQYAAPAGAPSVNLVNAISGATRLRESIAVYVVEGACRAPKKRTRLFYMRNMESEPSRLIKVEANRPLTFEYVETIRNGSTCRISLEANLEAGKRYSLIGGYDYESGPIPILTGTRICRFAVRDDTDKTLVSRESACPAK